MRQRYSYLKIRRLRDMGHSWRSIAEIMGCSKTTVRRALTDDIDGYKKKERERVRRLRNAPKKRDNLNEGNSKFSQPVDSDHQSNQDDDMKPAASKADLDDADLREQVGPYSIMLLDPDDPTIAGRERPLLEPIEGYAAYGCYHTKPASSDQD